MLKIDNQFTTWDGVVTAVELRLLDRRDPEGRTWYTVEFSGDGYCQSYRGVANSPDHACRMLGKIAVHLQCGADGLDLLGAKAKLVSSLDGLKSIDNAAGDQLLV